MTAAAIIDASAALAWVLPGEADTASDAVLAAVGRTGGMAPGLWRLEVANVLLRTERKGRISTGQRRAHLAFFADLPIAIDPETVSEAWSATLTIAERHALTVYDATYLELAIRLGLPLATRDRQLRAAAGDRGVALLG